MRTVSYESRYVDLRLALARCWQRLCDERHMVRALKAADAQFVVSGGAVTPMLREVA